MAFPPELWKPETTRWTPPLHVDRPPRVLENVASTAKSKKLFARKERERRSQEARRIELLKENRQALRWQHHERKRTRMVLERFAQGDATLAGDLSVLESLQRRPLPSTPSQATLQYHHFKRLGDLKAIDMINRRFRQDEAAQEMSQEVFHSRRRHMVRSLQSRSMDRINLERRCATPFQTRRRRGEQLGLAPAYDDSSLRGGLSSAPALEQSSSMSQLENPHSGLMQGSSSIGSSMNLLRPSTSPFSSTWGGSSSMMRLSQNMEKIAAPKDRSAPLFKGAAKAADLMGSKHSIISPGWKYPSDFIGIDFSPEAARMSPPPAYSRLDRDVGGTKLFPLKGY